VLFILTSLQLNFGINILHLVSLTWLFYKWTVNDKRIITQMAIKEPIGCMKARVFLIINGLTLRAGRNFPDALFSLGMLCKSMESRFAISRMPSAVHCDFK